MSTRSTRAAEPRPLEWEARALARRRNSLLAWYDAERRDLPWRRSRDPYRIWLSEVMLQQTRVEAVIPFYERFLERFPDAASLAAVSIDAVLPYWSGLGYYRRIRNFHAAVCRVVEELEGEVPRDERLAELPGVGPYTQAAVRSIAFGVAVPLVDGNVERVLARLFRWPADVRSASSKRAFHAFLERWIDPERAGDFNQALMELGATVCTPRAPRCDACPLRSACEARRAGVAEELPILPPRARAVEEAWVVLALQRGDELWLEQRPLEGLMGGLWELPTLAAPNERAARRRVEESAAADSPWIQLAGAGGAAADLGTLRHGILNRRIAARLYALGAAPGTRVVTERGRWFPRRALAELGITGFTRKALRRLESPPPASGGTRRASRSRRGSAPLEP